MDLNEWVLHRQMCPSQNLTLKMFKLLLILFTVVNGSICVLFSIERQRQIKFSFKSISGIPTVHKCVEICLSVSCKICLKIDNLSVFSGGKLRNLLMEWGLLQAGESRSNGDVLWQQLLMCNVLPWSWEYEQICPICHSFAATFRFTCYR